MKKIYNFILSAFFMGLFSLLTLSAHSQCDVMNASSSQISTGNGYDFWFGQSFTATCDGDLKSITLVASQAGTFSAGEFKVYSGNSVSDNDLIHSENYETMEIKAANELITINFTTNIPLVNGNQYTFMFYKNTSYNIYFIQADTYAGGNLWENTSSYTTHELVFTASIGGVSTGITSISNKVKVFPNPASDYLEINDLATETDFKVYNVIGAEVLKGNASNNDKINIKALTVGVYVLKFKDGDTFKFLKK